MTIKDFEEEIQKLDPGFSIVPNPNRPGLANIFYNNENYDLPPVPASEIKDEPDPSYFYEFPNGLIGRHKSRADVLPHLEAFLERVKGGKLKELYD